MTNFKLSPNFSFFELTKSDSHPEFIEKNRIYALNFKDKLIKCAEMLEIIRAHFNKPLLIHSCVRCPELNKAVGSTDRSQHLLCEAVDFYINGLGDAKGTDITVNWIWKESMIPFGQLIDEHQERGYIVNSWVHLSLGMPYRVSNKCLQVLSMTNGKYTRLN